MKIDKNYVLRVILYRYLFIAQRMQKMQWTTNGYWMDQMEARHPFYASSKLV